MAEPLRKSVGIVDVTFGTNVTIVEPANLYGCAIGDNCFIGPFVEIQRGVRIGRNCRIQSHSFICELVTIGDHVTVAHGVMFINDPYADGGPARGDRSKWRATQIGDGVSIGSNATILPVTVCAGAVIGAGAVVTSDVATPGVYAGNPARLLRPL
jgi:acetyltransferase-like isoleucine patch superfamily enzyme